MTVLVSKPSGALAAVIARQRAGRCSPILELGRARRLHIAVDLYAQRTRVAVENCLLEWGESEREPGGEPDADG